MNRYTTIWKAIVEAVIGRKYYANIINTKGTAKYEICSFIFTSKEQALKHKEQLDTTLSYSHVETISFRSRNIYPGVTFPRQYEITEERLYS
ncbi:MAG: hypothetical protein HDT08_04220 [Bacteroidales bacterium]|nr:hypothetical protein [Bacteroidales bacterium]